MWTPETRARHNRDHLRYGSDLSDKEWQVIAPFMPPPAETGRRRVWPMREMLNAIFYILRVGCPWRQLPEHFPPHQTTYRWFVRFRDEGLWESLSHQLAVLDRECVGREASPSVAVIDSQSVRTTSQGVLMVPGRLRSLLKMASPRRFADPSYLSRIGPELYGGAVRGRSDLLAAHAGRLRSPKARGYIYQILATCGWTSFWRLPWLCQPTFIAGAVPGSIHCGGGARAGRGIHHHPVKAAVPRLRNWPPMMTRWISEVPSQMRSTRTSRFSRSTAFSRI
jgi:transposase